MIKKIISIAVSAVMLFSGLSIDAFVVEKAYASEKQTATTKMETEYAPNPSNITLPEVVKLKIMLDAGHYDKYNVGYYKKYWESLAVWSITEYMEKAFSQYEGVVVGKTRTNQKKDLNIYERGKKAKGYDLFISNHTNAGGQTPDYPLVIAPKESKYFTTNVKNISKKIVNSIKENLSTKQEPQIWRNSSYGVIRGARDVGTPGLIIEHSFHSNPRICKLLMQDSVLKELAYDEADIIAKSYGAKKKTNEKPVIDVKTIDNTKNLITVLASKAKTNYEIYRGEDGGKYTKIGEIAGNDGKVDFTDSGLKYGKTYYYIAKPVTSTKVGEYSNPVGVIMPRVEAPAFDVSSYKYGMAKISWSNAQHADKYLVKRSDEKDGSYETIYESDKPGEYIDKAFPDGATKYYKVVAYNIQHDDYSKEPMAKAANIKGNLQKAVSFDAYGYGIAMAKVKWQPNIEGAQGYEVLRSTSNDGEYEKIASFTGDKISTTSYVDKDVTKGKRYYYKVRAFAKVLELENRVYYSLETSGNSATIVGNIATTKVNAYGYGVGSAVVKWDKAANANGYKIYRRAGKSGSYKYIAQTKSTSYKDKNVTRGKIYYYKVKPYRKTSAGTYYGKISLGNSASIISKVSRPIFYVAKSGTSSVKISWNKAKGATGYKIYRATSSKGKYRCIKIVKSSSARYYYDKNKKKGKTYYYKVRAYSSANKTYYSDYSKVKKIKR